MELNFVAANKMNSVCLKSPVHTSGIFGKICLQQSPLMDKIEQTCSGKFFLKWTPFII
jgi:hypothetical protein